MALSFVVPSAINNQQIGAVDDPYPQKSNSKSDQC
jgi:hypothetical protein